MGGVGSGSIARSRGTGVRKSGVNHVCHLRRDNGEDEAGQRSLIESAASRFQLASRSKHSSILKINERNRTSSIARSRSAVIRMFFLHGSQRTLGEFAASPILGEIYHVALRRKSSHRSGPPWPLALRSENHHGQGRQSRMEIWFGSLVAPLQVLRYDPRIWFHLRSSPPYERNQQKADADHHSKWGEHD